MNSIRYALVAVLALMGAEAHAVFHLWKMTELYSSADGNVQFLELASPSDGEGLLTNHALTSTVGGATRSYVFPSNLDFETAGKTFLVATQGFAALGLVAPDYIVPNGFFSASGGTVNFAGVDEWAHPALPTTGGLSLARDGSRSTNSPKNFAGATGTIPAPVPPVTALNFQGLWYKSPAESESGWGVNIAHQGDTFFVTWFTYDTDGSQMWLVGPSVTRGSGNSYSGVLYRTTGPAFNALPFTPIGASNISQLGTVTFSFTDANNGTFGYTVNGVTQSKAITRQVFGTMPVCTPGGSPGATPNFQDLWYAAPAESESGWGVNVTHQGDILFITWFTYDTSGRGMWVVGPRMERSGTSGTYTGPIYRTTGPAFSANPWNPAGVAATQVGTGTMTMTSGSTGTFNYTVNGITQTKNITKQVFGTPATVCR